MTWNPTENNVFAIFLLGQCSPSETQKVYYVKLLTYSRKTLQTMSFEVQSPASSQQQPAFTCLLL